MFQQPHINQMYINIHKLLHYDQMYPAVVQSQESCLAGECIKLRNILTFIHGYFHITTSQFAGSYSKYSGEILWKWLAKACRFLCKQQVGLCRGRSIKWEGDDIKNISPSPEHHRVCWEEWWCSPCWSSLPPSCHDSTCRHTARDTRRRNQTWK